MVLLFSFVDGSQPCKSNRSGFYQREKMALRVCQQPLPLGKGIRFLMLILSNYRYYTIVTLSACIFCKTFPIRANGRTRTCVFSFAEELPLPCIKDLSSRKCRSETGETGEKQKSPRSVGLVFCMFCGIFKETTSTRMNPVRLNIPSTWEIFL